MAANAEGQMEKTPLMTLSIGIVTPKQQSFADIREITELAADVRRQDASSLPVKDKTWLLYDSRSCVFGDSFSPDRGGFLRPGPGLAVAPLKEAGRPGLDPRSPG